MEADKVITITEVNWVGYLRTSSGPPRITMRLTVRKMSLNISVKFDMILIMVTMVAMSPLVHLFLMILFRNHDTPPQEHLSSIFKNFSVRLGYLALSTAAAIAGSNSL